VIFGMDNWQKNGVSTSDAGDGDVNGGFNTPGNSNTTINGVACNLGGEAKLTSTSYHVHTFLGLFVNGTQYAIPDGLGMMNPTNDEPISNFSNACFIHTHAPSGIIHVEDPTNTENFSVEYPQYSVQSLLAIWGYGSITNLVSAIAPGFSGPINVYVGTPCPGNAVGCASPQKNPNGNGDDLVTTYTLQSAPLGSVLFGHHVAIWIIAGSMPAAGVPAIDFAIST
jgi:hypothetical protein